MIAIVFSIFAISCISLLVSFLLSLKIGVVKTYSCVLVSFASGALLGDVFFHIVPEIFSKDSFSYASSVFILLGVVLFFILEKFICWRHCHTTEVETKNHPLIFMNLIGDGIHNILDGALVSASYLIDMPLGIATTIAVIAHEIPQEIGDFSILIHSGLSKTKALVFNFLSAILSFVGAFLVLGISKSFFDVQNALIAITAGGFIYIAGSDLIPELKKHISAKSSALQLISMCCGMFVMFALLALEQ
jgi:zinc and cadmium transporter